MNYYFCGIYKCIASAIPVYSIILYIGLESVKQNRSLLRVQNSVTYIVLIIHCPGCTVLVHFYNFFMTLMLNSMWQYFPSIPGITKLYVPLSFAIAKSAKTFQQWQGFEIYRYHLKYTHTSSQNTVRDDNNKTNQCFGSGWIRFFSPIRIRTVKTRIPIICYKFTHKVT